MSVAAGCHNSKSVSIPYERQVCQPAGNCRNTTKKSPPYGGLFKYRMRSVLFILLGVVDFQFDGNLDIVTDHYPTAVERLAPGDLEVLAVNGSDGGK